MVLSSKISVLRKILLKNLERIGSGLNLSTETEKNREQTDG
jgi:hypothetical protein